MFLKIANYTIDDVMKIHLCALVSPTQAFQQLFLKVLLSSRDFQLNLIV